MKTLIVTYLCGTKENRDAFYTGIVENGIGEKCENEKGCESYKYYFPAFDDTSLLLIEEWENEEALTAHKFQPHMSKLMELKEKYDVKTVIK